MYIRLGYGTELNFLYNEPNDQPVGLGTWKIWPKN